MKSQPIKKTNAVPIKNERKVKLVKGPKGRVIKRTAKQKYGTSKLELDFARDFLDKLGVKYIYQYEAKDIGRFFDFAVTAYTDINFIMEEKDGITCIKQEGQNVPISFCIEVDGGYYHSDPRIVDERKLNPMQKHNKVVDFVKDRWCGLHGLPLLRIWEYDIRHNQKKVFDELYKYLGDGYKKKRIRDNKRKPH
jgi:hypothetical protein